LNYQVILNPFILLLQSSSFSNSSLISFRRYWSYLRSVAIGIDFPNTIGYSFEICYILIVTAFTSIN